MSDNIKHECGIALIRLLKPLEYYKKKYGTAFYAMNKLCLLMEKQYNRGQDGAGIVSLRFNLQPGTKYISRMRSVAASPIKDIFDRVNSDIIEKLRDFPDDFSDIPWLKNNIEFCSELMMGHLRYGTYGKNDIEACHPVMRHSNWPSRNLMLAGNFNLTNVDSLFRRLLEIGQHPQGINDTVTILEKIGYHLDEENNEMIRKYKQEGLPRSEIHRLIAENIDVLKILRDSCDKWDGGYVISGIIGNGDAFVIRDPAGIRPAYYHIDDEVAVVCSERPPIQTAFNIPLEKITELEPASAIIIRKNGRIQIENYKSKLPRKPCSFERIYFSRGSDYDIYKERKDLGRLLLQDILKIVDYDLNNTVFSYIPNTAEVCFYGIIEGLESYCNELSKRIIMENKDNLTDDLVQQVFSMKPRFEKIAVKDVKLRTFITNDIQRDNLVAHVYDITYGTIRPGTDTLVAVDDSVVRGTTMKESILRILDRLGARKIIIASTAPQIRYPDCYGIDMAKLGDFVAFRAAIELLKSTNRTDIIDETYRKAKEEENYPAEKVTNHVQDIYRPFTPQQLSDKIAELVSPAGMKAEVRFVFQSIENLHKACPCHKGDWYFTGDYPTPGGNKVANKAFINYIEGKNERAY